MKPLNGEHTHPLSQHALAELRDIAERGPVPRQSVNPGVANRLEREVLVEEFDHPSPFKTHNAKPIRFLRITQAGRNALSAGEST